MFRSSVLRQASHGLENKMPAPVAPTAECFTAYLKGGRIWPQRRGVNLLVSERVVHSVLHDAQPIQIQDFRNSTFSARQLNAVKIVMERDHARAGIPHRAQMFSDSLLQKEWESSKYSVLVSLYNYFAKAAVYDLDSLRSMLASEVTAMAAEIEARLQAHDREVDRLIEALQLTRTVILENIDLAKIFILSYASDGVRLKLYNEQKEFYALVLERYGLQSSLEHEPLQLRRECEELIEKFLLEAVSSKVNHAATLVWGFKKEGAIK